MLIAISHPHRVVARPAFRSTPRIPIRSSLERQQRRKNVAKRRRAMSERDRQRLIEEGRQGGRQPLVVFARKTQSKSARKRAEGRSKRRRQQRRRRRRRRRRRLPSFVRCLVRSFVGWLPSASAFVTPRHDAAQRRRVVDAFVGAVCMCVGAWRCNDDDAIWWLDDGCMAMAVSATNLALSVHLAERQTSCRSLNQQVFVTRTTNAKSAGCRCDGLNGACGSK